MVILTEGRVWTDVRVRNSWGHSLQMDPQIFTGFPSGTPTGSHLIWEPEGVPCVSGEGRGRVVFVKHFQRHLHYRGLCFEAKDIALAWFWNLILSSVQFSRSVMSNSLRPHGLQPTRPPCPSPPPRVYSNSCPSSRWCHAAISSSVVPFSSCPQSFLALGSFLMSQLFAWGGQSNGISASASVLPMKIQDWFPLGWTGSFSLQSKGVLRVFSNTNLILGVKNFSPFKPPSALLSHSRE